MAKQKWNVPEPFDPKNPSITFNTEDPNTQSLTSQSDKDSTDINLLLARFEKSGLIPDDLGGYRQPVYGDFSDVPNYHTLQNALAKANEAFAALPVSVRNKFNNDPQQLIDFCADPKNDKEAVKLGLKDYSVLQTALADDGVTKITPEERANIDALKAAKAAEAQPQPAAKS